MIGAGIVGAATAVELLRDGHRVTILDPGDPGGEQAASYGNGTLRTTNEQNFVLPYVSGASLPAVYHRLDEIGLSEAYAKKFLVRWTWPVPLPPKNAKLARMIGGGGLGETGGGSCQICDWRGTYPYGLTCKAATSGYSDCQSDINYPNQCSYSTPCTSGKFGTLGGNIIMY